MSNTKSRFQSLSIEPTPPPPLPSLSSIPVVTETPSPGTEEPEILHDLEFFQSFTLDSSTTKMFQDLNRLSDESSKIVDRLPQSLLNDQIGIVEKFIDSLVHFTLRFQGTTIDGKQTNSSFCILAGYIYLYIFLRKIPAESSIYMWMTTLLRQDFNRLDPQVLGYFPSELLFWVLFVGGLVASNKNDQDWFTEKLGEVSKKLELKSLRDVRKCLKKLSWVVSNEGVRCQVLWDKIAGSAAMQ